MKKQTKEEKKAQAELKSVQIEDDGSVTFKDILKNSSMGAEGDKLVLAWRYNQQIEKNREILRVSSVSGAFQGKVCDYDFDLSKKLAT